MAPFQERPSLISSTLLFTDVRKSYYYLLSLYQDDLQCMNLTNTQTHQTHTQTHIHIHIHTQTQTNKHTHTHTHTPPYICVCAFRSEEHTSELQSHVNLVCR